MNEERIWLLAGLRFSGEATAEELEELHALLASNPELSAKLKLVEAVWKNPVETAGTPVPSADDAYDRHLQRLLTQAAPSRQGDEPGYTPKAGKSGLYPVRKMVWMGAVAAMAVALMVLVYRLNPAKEPAAPLAASIITTKPGSRSKVRLPDGSQVWLNADSRLTYYKNFGAGTREVELNGEAYFDVVKDKTRPFVIHTRSISVKVLGTAFNVRSYPSEKTSETSLIRGSVEITLNSNPGRKIILKPNEKLVVRDTRNGTPAKQNAPVQHETPELRMSQVHYLKGDSSSIETCWTRNKLAFEGETLENVAGKIERWYDVKITITDEKLKNDEYTSVFEDESLAEVMHALQLTGNFRYTINRKEVVISP